MFYVERMTGEETTEVDGPEMWIELSTFVIVPHVPLEWKCMKLPDVHYKVFRDRNFYACLFHSWHFHTCQTPRLDDWINFHRVIRTPLIQISILWNFSFVQLPEHPESIWLYQYRRCFIKDSFDFCAIKTSLLHIRPLNKTIFGTNEMFLLNSRRTAMKSSLWCLSNGDECSWKYNFFFIAPNKAIVCSRVIPKTNGKYRLCWFFCSSFSSFILKLDNWSWRSNCEWLTKTFWCTLANFPVIKSKRLRQQVLLQNLLDDPLPEAIDAESTVKVSSLSPWDQSDLKLR